MSSQRWQAWIEKRDKEREAILNILGNRELTATQVTLELYEGHDKEAVLKRHYNRIWKRLTKMERYGMVEQLQMQSCGAKFYRKAGLVIRPPMLPFMEAS